MRTHGLIGQLTVTNGDVPTAKMRYFLTDFQSNNSRIAAAAHGRETNE